MDTTELVREFQAHHADVKAALDKAGVKDNELDARMREIEQKVARRGGGTPEPEDQTWGAQVLQAENLKHVHSNWRGRERIEVKTTATLTHATSSAGAAGALSPADRRAGYIPLARRRLRMRDVFAQGRTDKNGIEWAKQTARSNNAASVAEGALKPQSDATFDLETWPVRTFAHWMLASKQILDDVPALASIVDSELRYGLAYVEDNQLLNGAGSGTDLTGVYTNATAFSAPITITDPTKIDVLLQAIAQVQAADYEPDFIAVNPLDWASILAEKTADGAYLGNGPFSAQAEVLWRLPVVATKAMTADKFLVGAGQQGAQIFDRETVTVEVSTEDSTNFRYNLCTIRAEQRLAFVIKYEDAFVKGDFSDAMA